MIELSARRFGLTPRSLRGVSKRTAWVKARALAAQILVVRFCFSNRAAGYLIGRERTTVIALMDIDVVDDVVEVLNVLLGQFGELPDRLWGKAEGPGPRAWRLVSCPQCTCKRIRRIRGRPGWCFCVECNHEFREATGLPSAAIQWLPCPHCKTAIGIRSDQAGDTLKVTGLDDDGARSAS